MPAVLTGLFILFCLNFPAGAIGGLYVISIEVENAPAGKFGKEMGNKLINQKLSAFRECIDFSRTKAAGNLDRFSGTFRMLSHSGFQAADIDLLRSSICGKQDDCDVQVESEYVANSDLKLGLIAEKRERGVSVDAVKFKLPRALPRFSDSCETGEDRRMNTGNTEQARKFLREVGIDRKNVGSLELFHGAKSVYNFGHFNP